jgi:hypothetical protein
MLIKALAEFEGTLPGRASNRVIELGEAEPRVYGAGYAEQVVASGHEAPGMRGAAS